MGLFRFYKKHFSLLATAALFALTVFVSFHGHGAKSEAGFASSVSSHAASNASSQDSHDCPACLGRQQLASASHVFLSADWPAPEKGGAVSFAYLASVPSLESIVSEPARGPPSV